MTGGVETFPWQPGDLWAGLAMVPKQSVRSGEFDPGTLVELLVVYDPERRRGVAIHPRTHRILARDLGSGGFVWKHDPPEVCTISGLGGVILDALSAFPQTVPA